MYDIDLLKKDLEGLLSEKRYKHSLSVAAVAMELANIYGIDKDKAYLAGMVHDIAKEFSDEENDYYIEKYNLPKVEEEYKRIIHSYVGAVYLKEKYNMDDDICGAVSVHTTGSLNMSMLDKIVFVSDKIEPGKDYPGIDEERKLAKEDIDKCVILCLENNYRKLLSKGKRMHPLSSKVLCKLKNIL